MEKDNSQLQLYQHFLSFFLPEGILDFFEPVWMETQSLDSRESKKDILYSSSLHIYLDERDNRPDDLQELRPNGFTEETVISDFPVRDRKAVLHVRRRRWLTPEGKNVVLNVYPLAATGTRYCAELLVDKPLVKIIGPYKPVTQSSQTRPCSKFNQIEASFSRIKRNLGSEHVRKQ